jgi:hypothetical protein
MTEWVVEGCSRQAVQEGHRAYEGILKIHLEYSVACSTCSLRDVGCFQRGVTDEPTAGSLVALAFGASQIA